MSILFSLKKHFKRGSRSKSHIHMKRELSHETSLPEIIPTTKHMLCDIVSCQYYWVQLQILAKITSSPGPLRSNMVKRSIPSSAVRFCTDLCGDRSTKVATTAQVTVRDICRLLWEESFIFLYIHTLFFHTERVAVHRHGFQNRCWNFVITWFIIWSMLSLHPNTCYKTLLNRVTAHNCHSHLYTIHY